MHPRGQRRQRPGGSATVILGTGDNPADGICPRGLETGQAERHAIDAARWVGQEVFRIPVQLGLGLAVPLPSSVSRSSHWRNCPLPHARGDPENRNGQAGSLATFEASASVVWLDGKLATSTKRWKIGCIHHGAYSSGSPADYNAMKRDWPGEGYHVVLQAHIHNIERLFVSGMAYYTICDGRRQSSRLGRLPGCWFHLSVAGHRHDGHCLPQAQ